MGILNIMRSNGIREGHRPVRCGCAALHACTPAPAAGMSRLGSAAGSACWMSSSCAALPTWRCGCWPAGQWGLDHLFGFGPPLLPLHCEPFLALTGTAPSQQGIEEHFLEQWHQKLHTNTTPEDVTICEVSLLLYCELLLYRSCLSLKAICCPLHSGLPALRCSRPCSQQALPCSKHTCRLLPHPCRGAGVPGIPAQRGHGRVLVSVLT